MPLLDHFHEPLKPRRHWTSFHSAWATCIAFDLNRRLPKDYVAEPNAKFNIEIDVATLRDSGVPENITGLWQPPAPTMTVAFTAITDIVEVQVMNLFGGANLVGAIEIVSPGNKDREATREAFVSKCAGYLQEGVGLIVIDIVTERRAKFHDQILSRVGAVGERWNADLSVVSYHPVQCEEKKWTRAQEVLEKSLEIWPFELKVGSPLPTLPMCLKGGVSLPLDLEAVYMRTCQESRIPLNGQ